MIFKALSALAVKVSLSSDEIRIVHELIQTMDRTDFNTLEDFIRIHLMHAQETLDCFKKIDPNGNPT